MNASRNVCIVFADVSGSAKLIQRLGDAEATRAVERCLNRVERAVASSSGRVIKTVGDEIMAVFKTAEDGFNAACDMQHRVEALPAVSGIKLSVRIGYHYGPSAEKEGEASGETVDLAVRMAELAKDGQIVTTGDAVDALPPSLRQSAREIGSVAVKGRREAVRLCDVSWQKGKKPAAAATDAPGGARLKLRHDNKELTLDPAHPTALLGRDLSSDVVIRDPRASRNHGRIELRGKTFVLIDQSTNGTYVSAEGEFERGLKRQETPLSGRGRISFGHPWAESKGEALEFEVLG